MKAHSRGMICGRTGAEAYRNARSSTRRTASTGATHAARKARATPHRVDDGDARRTELNLLDPRPLRAPTLVRDRRGANVSVTASTFGIQLARCHADCPSPTLLGVTAGSGASGGRHVTHPLPFVEERIRSMCCTLAMIFCPCKNGHRLQNRIVMFYTAIHVRARMRRNYYRVTA